MPTGDFPTRIVQADEVVVKVSSGSCRTDGAGYYVNKPWMGIVCGKCGKPTQFVGDLLDWNSVCQCYFGSFHPPIDTVPVQIGWICPRCDKVKGPHVDECDCEFEENLASNAREVHKQATTTLSGRIMVEFCAWSISNGLLEPSEVAKILNAYEQYSTDG